MSFNENSLYLVADSQRKLVPIHNNGRAIGLHENGALPLSVHLPQNGASHGHNGGNDVSRKYEMTRIPSGDSGIILFPYLL